MEKTNKLDVKVVNFKGCTPIQDVNVKVFKIEKEPITPEQWAENLKNGSPFKSLVLSMNTDNNGKITAQIPWGSYEVKVEKYGLNQVCELNQNIEVLLIVPKKHWS